MDHTIDLTNGLPEEGTYRIVFSRKTLEEELREQHEQRISKSTSDDRLFGNIGFNIGNIYFLSLNFGIIYGSVKGLLNAQRGSYRLALNAMFNQAGKTSIRTANMLGIATLLYQITHLTIEKLVVKDNFFGAVISGGIAGFLFRLPKGLRRAPLGIVPGMLLGAVLETMNKGLFEPEAFKRYMIHSLPGRKTEADPDELLKEMEGVKLE